MTHLKEFRNKITN